MCVQFGCKICLSQSTKTRYLAVFSFFSHNIEMKMMIFLATSSDVNDTKSNQNQTTIHKVEACQISETNNYQLGSDGPYSSDLVPCDFHLHLKPFLASECYDDVKLTVQQQLSSQVESFYEEDVTKLVLCYDKYLYIGKIMWTSSFSYDFFK